MAGDRGDRRGSILLGALAALLLVDLFFIAGHVIAYLAGTLRAHPEWSVETDRGYAEIYQYAKWGSIALSCAYLAYRQREAVYAALAVIFVYFLLDDSIAIHETAGAWIRPLFGSARIWSLRPQDFGEIIVVAVAGCVLLAILAFGYRRSRAPARAFAREVGALIVLLALFGVAVDMVHSAAFALVPGARMLPSALGLLEDGGEMVIASIIAYRVAREAVAPRSCPPS